ncbi:hypothetical protein OSTOST_18552 [Ostertagia ostertagi]
MKKKRDSAQGVEIRNGDDAGVTIVHADNVYINYDSDAESVATSKRPIKIKTKDLTEMKATHVEQEPCQVTRTYSAQAVPPCQQLEVKNLPTPLEQQQKRPIERKQTPRRVPHRTPPKVLSVRTVSATPTRRSLKRTPSRTPSALKRTPIRTPGKKPSSRTPSAPPPKFGITKRTVSTTPSKASTTPSKTPRGKKTYIKETIETTVTTTTTQNVPGKSPKTKKDVKRTTKVNIYPESEYPEKVGDVPKTEIISHTKFSTSDKHKQQMPQTSQRSSAVGSSQSLKKSQPKWKSSDSSSLSSRKAPVCKDTSKKPPFSSTALVPCFTSSQSVAEGEKRPLPQPKDPYRPGKTPVLIQRARENIEKSRQQMKQSDDERRASKKSGKSPTPFAQVRKGEGKSPRAPGRMSSNRTPASTTGRLPSDRSSGKPVTASTDTAKGSTSSDSKFVYSPPRGKPVIRVVKKSSRVRHRKVEKDPDLKTARESESYLELANRWAVAGRKLKQTPAKLENVCNPSG